MESGRSRFFFFGYSTGRSCIGQTAGENRIFSSQKKEKEGEKEGEGNIIPTVFRKKEEDSPFDLGIEQEEENGCARQLWGYPETVFFEEEKEEWQLQWKERGRTKTAVLKDMPVTVGKIRQEVSVVMEDDSVSRIHCRFIENNGGIAIMDMNSTNGTSLNGMKLRPGEIMGIAKNDEILIGKVRALVV